MRKRLVGPLLAFSVGILWSSIGVAQATRTWVSGVGDDANPCSRTAPCKTFAGAISKTAPSGEIDVLDPGGFGALTITKPIIIDGGDSQSGVLVAGTNGFAVSAGPTDAVVVRHLKFNGLGPTGSSLAGIKFLSGGSLTVEDCVIEGFGGASSFGIDFEPTSGTTASLQVTNTIIRNNTGGIMIGNSATKTTAQIVDCTITGNGRAAVRADTNATVMVSRTIASGGANGFTACSVGSGSPILSVDESSATNNAGFGIGAGGATCTGGIVYLSNSVSMGNGGGLVIGNFGAILSFGGNKICCNTAFNGPPTGSVALQ
jgi:hypothetical protein